MTLVDIERLNAAQADDLWNLYQQVWWTRERTPQQIQAMLARNELVFGVAEADTGRLVAFARAISDYVFKALVLDVIVDEPLRTQGLGRRIIDRIVHDPRLAQVVHIELYCRPDLVPFYAQWGFTDDLGGLVLLRRRRPL
ncbi:MAG: GNAT family N-acetyltransferase [Pirellulales bacterium]|nr:GNAT family N-acetyltransferase [Pirellulales bacterium]